MNTKYAYVVVGQEVFGLGDTADEALADAAQYLEGGLTEAQQCLDDGLAVVVLTAEARSYCRMSYSSILEQCGL